MVDHDKGWKKLYADLIKIYNVGYGTLFGRVSGIMNLFFTVATFLLVKGLDLGYIEIIIIGVIVISAIMIMGYIYLRMDLAKSEFSSNFREQPELVQMKNEISEIKRLLEEKNDDNVYNIDSE